MSTHAEYTQYENLPAVILRGPLKSRAGIVKSVTMRDTAWMELRGSHSQANTCLQEVNLEQLAFELYFYPQGIQVV